MALVCTGLTNLLADVVKNVNSSCLPVTGGCGDRADLRQSAWNGTWRIQPSSFSNDLLRLSCDSFRAFSRRRNDMSSGIHARQHRPRGRAVAKGRCKGMEWRFRGP
jgi:hypothetical protein